MRCPYCNENNMPTPKRTARPFGKCPDCGKKSRASIHDSISGQVYVHYSATSLPKLEEDDRKKTYSIRLSNRDVKDIENDRKFLAIINGRIRLLYKTQFYSLLARKETMKGNHVPPRIACYVIPHLWDRNDVCLHCGFARSELYGDGAVEHTLAADGANEPEHTGIPETCKHPDCVRLFQRPAAKA